MNFEYNPELENDQSTTVPQDSLYKIFDPSSFVNKTRRIVFTNKSMDMGQPRYGHFNKTKNSRKGSYGVICVIRLCAKSNIYIATLNKTRIV